MIRHGKIDRKRVANVVHHSECGNCAIVAGDAWTCHTGRFALRLLATLCRQNLVRLRWALRDHKHRRRLRSVAFGVMQVTSEADVQDRRVGRRIRDSPEERCTPRVEPCDPHGKRTAAVQRQPSLALTPRQRNVRKRVLPLDHDLLPGVENLSRHWRQQLGRILV